MNTIYTKKYCAWGQLNLDGILGVTAWFWGCLTTIVVVAGNRRRWGVWWEKAEMVRFSTKGYYDNIAGDGDGKFCAKSMFISKYYSVVA